MPRLVGYAHERISHFVNARQLVDAAERSNRSIAHKMKRLRWRRNENPDAWTTQCRSQVREARINTDHSLRARERCRYTRQTGPRQHDGAGDGFGQTLDAKLLGRTAPIKLNRMTRAREHFAERYPVGLRPQLFIAARIHSKGHRPRDNRLHRLVDSLQTKTNSTFVNSIA